MDRAAGDGEVAVDEEAVAACGNIAAGDVQDAAGDVQDAAAGDGELAAGVDAVACPGAVAAGSGDSALPHQDQVDGRVAVMIVDGGVLMAALGDGGAVEGQGAAVPHDVVVVLAALDRDGTAAAICFGIGGDIRTAGQRLAAHIDGLARRQRRRGQQGQAQGQAGQDAEQSSFVQVGSSFRVPAALRLFPGRRRFSLLHTPSWEPGNWW